MKQLLWLSRPENEALLEDDALIASVLRPLLCPDAAAPAPTGFADTANNIQRGIAAEVQAAARLLSIPDGSVLTVAVAGTMSRIGTTTQAIMLCRFVQSLGTQTMYLDPADLICNLVHAAYAQGLEHLQVAIAPLPGFSGGVQVVDMGVLDDTVYRQLVLPRMQEVCRAWQP